MGLIEWKDSYALGIDEVDREHRELIELLNELHSVLCSPGPGPAGPAAGDLFGEVFARISAHFALEEREMREAGYPQLPEHKREHERLLDEIRDVMDDYEDGRYVDVEALGRRLDDWFSVHFRTFDARLHRADARPT